MGSTVAPDLEAHDQRIPARPVRTGRARVMRLPLDCLGMEETLGWIAAAVEERRTNAHSTSITGPDTTRHVVTLNPEMAVQAQRDASLRAAILDADLVVPDGVGVVWAARGLGSRVPGRVPGVDLLDNFAGLAALPGYRLFLLGGAPGVAEAAVRRLEARHAGSVICGAYAGSPDPVQAPDVLDRIRAARPDVLFVAFGSPAQECWIASHRGQLGAAVAVGVGGALDFLAGRVPRAPLWMRRAGLEWGYRLWRQPWRWRRMLALPRFAATVAGEVVAARVGQLAGAGVHRGHD